jgi:putative phage-type endonuclease
MPAKLLMTQHEIDLHRDRWQEYRSASIGASEIGVLLGLAPRRHGNPFTLFVEKKTGESLDGGVDSDDDEMERGRALEGVVAEKLAAKRPDLLVLPGGLYQDEECPWMTASFDRFTASRELLGNRLSLVHTALAESDPEIMKLMVPAELKTALSRNDQATGRQVWGEEYTDQVPAHIKAQAYWQMRIWGSDRVLVPVQFMGSWKTAIYVVNRTRDAEIDIGFMTEEAIAFLDRLERDDPPDLDWTPETAKALRLLTPVEPETVYRASQADARRLRRMYAAKKRAEKAYGLFQNQLAAKAGGAQKIVVTDPERAAKDGTALDVTVLDRRLSHPKRVDVEKLRKDYPVQAGLCEVTTDVDAWYPGQRWMNLG